MRTRGEGGSKVVEDIDRVLGISSPPNNGPLERFGGWSWKLTCDDRVGGYEALRHGKMPEQAPLYNHPQFCPIRNPPYL
jgi:hypothetical protein